MGSMEVDDAVWKSVSLTSAGICALAKNKNLFLEDYFQNLSLRHVEVDSVHLPDGSSRLSQTGNRSYFLGVQDTNTNSRLGAWATLFKVLDHPILGPVCTSELVNYMNDCKIHRHIQEPRWCPYVDQVLLRKLLPPALMPTCGLMLHTMLKLAKKLMHNYDKCFTLLFEKLTHSERWGRGKYKPNSFKFGLQSAFLGLLLNAYLGDSTDGNLRSVLMDLKQKFPMDFAVNSLLLLLDCAIPLLFWHKSLVVLGDSDDVATRRMAFDALQDNYVGMMLVFASLDAGFSNMPGEYEKELILHLARLYRNKHEMPKLYSIERDACTRGATDELIELWHARVMQQTPHFKKAVFDTKVVDSCFKTLPVRDDLMSAMEQGKGSSKAAAGDRSAYSQALQDDTAKMIIILRDLFAQVKENAEERHAMDAVGDFSYIVKDGFNYGVRDSVMGFIDQKMLPKRHLGLEIPHRVAKVNDDF